MWSTTATVFLHEATVFKALALRLKLMTPAAMERHKLISMIRQWQRWRKFIQAVFITAFIGDGYTLLDDVRFEIQFDLNLELQ